jgi:hypothetical protein
MPQGFTYLKKNASPGEVEIRAICGPKGICYPNRTDWDDIVGRDSPLADREAEARKRQAAVDQLIERARETKDTNDSELPLWEELDHFKYITHSRVCSALLVANPYVRWAHSAAAVSLGAGPDERIARLVLRYHVTAATYFWRAEPLVEAAFLHRIRQSHPERLERLSPRQARQFGDFGHGAGPAPGDYAAVGRATDWLFLGEEPPSGSGELRLSFRLAGKFSWMLQGIHLGHVGAMWRMTPLVWRWASARFRRTSIQPKTTGAKDFMTGYKRRPFIWAPHIWADPVIHAAGIAVMPGIDAHHGQREKFLADLWWFVLRTCAEVHVLDQEKVSRTMTRLLLARDAAFFTEICRRSHADEDFDEAGAFLGNWSGRLVDRTLKCHHAREDRLLATAVQGFGEMRQALSVIEAELMEASPSPKALAYPRLFDVPYIQI